ncbi:helix-turn-helix transcriptional regulator [Planctomycetota bacterium]
MTKENKNQTTEQFLINAKTFGLRLSLSKRQIFRLNACGKITAPIRIGGAVRWRQTDIEDFIAWGCPDRKTFEAMLQAKGERC